MVGFVIVSLIVLSVRWSVITDRVPLAMPVSNAVAQQEPETSFSIPADQNTPPPSKRVDKKQIHAELVNVNVATVTTLETLPGIGAVLADRIIDYRNRNGPFDKLSDLDKVSGIGSKKLESIEGMVTF